MEKAVFIIPFYNEEGRIELEDFQFAFKNFSNIHFLLVDDGSTDKTQEMLKELTADFQNVFCLLNQKNIGKAEAIRRAVLDINQDQYEYLGYLDADLATPISEMCRLLDFISTNKQLEFVMGSRIKLLGNQVHRSLVRHYFGRIFATIISQFILKIPVYDTQCGAKIIKLNLAKAIFKKPFKTKWLFDVELLLRFKKLELNFDKKTAEFPLQVWIEKGGSKIKFSDLLKVPFQLLKIYFHYV